MEAGNNNFLKARHAAYATPEDDIFRLVQKATGQQPQSSQKIVRGYDNEVYAVKTQQGQVCIVRINRHGKTGFDQEAWALEKCRAAGVPVPEILLIDVIEVDEHKDSVMVQRKLPGAALSDIQKSLTQNELQAVFCQAGEILSKIHSIKVNGFYKRHADGSWDFSTWHKVMMSALKDRAAEKTFILASGFSETEFNVMLGLLKRYRDGFVCDQPVLCHGDFLPDHIFVDERLVISGIIDFGEFQGGPPIHDFARLSLGHPEIKLDWLKFGYADKTIFEHNFGTRLTLHKIPLQMGYLAHYVQSGNTEAATVTAAGLRTTLDIASCL